MQPTYEINGRLKTPHIRKRYILLTLMVLVVLISAFYADKWLGYVLFPNVHADSSKSLQVPDQDRHSFDQYGNEFSAAGTLLIPAANCHAPNPYCQPTDQLTTQPALIAPEGGMK